MARLGDQYERVFRCFDEDGDGKLSPSELRRRVCLTGGVLLLTEAEVVVESLDSDGDGLLCLEDFVGFMENASEEEKTDDLREAFGMYATDGCGFITPKSLKRMLSRLGQSKSMDECEAMIGHFDLDGDGVISFDEFKRVFRCFDEDGDGKLSPSELRQRVGLMGGELLLKEAEVAIESLDSDGDGLLCLEDFIGFMEGGDEEEKMGDLREAFGMYATEGCGFITPKSLKRMLSRLGQSESVDECEAMIVHFDVDGDGVISFDEFKVMMM
ncbi:LOW QUALITY PROTEIN: putative calcium-binding protein CML23 [Rhodamnia argentea]|uniref:LOW QUALITY PROTEIN: putative calcium-binding protein CML23 n=1 Tax=Rhodamnia argentea TaxID=178133 RepID=A0ABM3HL74_9MYRT|nr:LOW QUALITY PROTEIN: putative calcium-binding protein CML23 [Rhodamnia argentea]